MDFSQVDMAARRFFVLFLLLCSSLAAQDIPVKKVLIVVEGNSELTNFAIGDGRQLANLLAHFSTTTTVEGITAYTPHQLESFDFTFFIGFHSSCQPTESFMQDVAATSKPVIWMNTGFAEFGRRVNAAKKFGFSVVRFDSTSSFDAVRSGEKQFTKGEPNINVVEVANRSAVSVIATASSSKKRTTVPYIVRSKNLTYIADSPFASASETDRYLLFADMLHDILGEDHETVHSALIRIEDVDPLENPEQLRNVADLLASKGVPFIVSVIPFYVDPGEGVRISLSDKPEFVDALKYMVKNGGTIAMHGVTHQYKGVTASDFEFWDESTNKPIKGETEEEIARKLDIGIQEFMKNGLYPLLWETPHYTASFKLYRTVSKYFSTAMEQRLSIEDFDYSQYFPYVIKKDQFGQRIYPENLGYVPLNPDKSASKQYIQNLLQKAKNSLYVRDGYASLFFHPFLDLELLDELVDGIQKLGFTYADLSEQPHWVRTSDRVILSGSQSYTITMHDQYLAESYYDHSGEIVNRTLSETRLNGPVTKNIQLEPGEFYKAEPTEFREKPVSTIEQITSTAEHLYENIVAPGDNWNEARAAVLWNHFARGAAYHDQASFASVLHSVRVPVDTIFLGEPIDLKNINILIVPFAFVDSLSKQDYSTITQFVKEGGNIITDGENDLAAELGISYINARLRVISVRDKYYPEEKIEWRNSELVKKYETDQIDEVFCYDEITEAPLVIGRKVGKGRFIYINSLYDAHSNFGYSQYPFLMDYVRKYFNVKPVVRRENLEVYFDPGFRHTYSIEQLITQWVRNGIRIVHVAGWHEYPKYTYDYERLLRLAHANGILVYAWLEPPQVSQKFWLAHPEWREKNYKGEDVRPSWRYPVALWDEKCVAEMTAQYVAFLKRFDWDGVNIAELYFEAGRGFQDPLQYTPMHPSAVKEFQSRHHIDITKIFDPHSSFYWEKRPDIRQLLTNERVDRITNVYHTLLRAVAPIAAEKPGFETIVTAMDELGSPELRENIGVDMNSILQLQKQYGFVLQVEDPEAKWSLPPQRYVEIGKRYDALVGDTGKVMLDLNILEFRKKGVLTPFPTAIQTGAESYHLINAAALGSDRFTTYSESSVNPQDLAIFANAAAAQVTYRRTENGFVCSAPYHFIVRLPKGISQIVLDGSVISPFRANQYLIPAGEHTVTFSNEGSGSFSTSQLNTKILSFTGNLLSVQYGLRNIAFTYESSARTLMSLSAVPTSVTVDGRSIETPVMKGNDCYSIFLPPGKHAVELVAGDQFSFGINVTSLWSTTAIAILGTVSIILMFLMYISLKIIKRAAARK